MSTKGTTDRVLWQAIARLDDDLLDPDFPDAFVEAELMALGLDAASVGSRGVAFVAALRDEQRLAWQANAKKQQAEMKRRAALVDVSLQMDRASLLSRIEQLRATDPRVGTAIKMAARKRRPEESTDEELRALLLEMETLRSLEGDEPE